jgi:Ca-activated chloride channel family protein
VFHVHFAQPLVLLLLQLPLPALILWWAWRRRSALRFPQVDTLRRLPKGRSRWAQRTGVALRALGLAALIIALAGPQWPDEGSRLPTQGISIALVLDVSGSMAEKDFEWEGAKVSRLEAARKVLRRFIEGGTGPEGQQFAGRENDLLSLVVFATRPDTVCPLTLSHSVLEQILEQQQPRTVPVEARTNIGDALVEALTGLTEAGQGRKVIVLFTDGEHNVKPPALTPTQAAHLAGNLGIPIHVIDAGREGTEPSPFEDEKTNRARAQKYLKQVASISHGEYFQAGDTRALVEVCSQIDALERQEILTYQYRRYQEGFPWFSLGAFVCFFGIHLLEATFWRRLP